MGFNFSALEMNAFLVSMLSVGVAEIGDRSMFLAVVLGLRYKRPWPVFAGMCLGLFLNQALSATVGVWLLGFIPMNWLPWFVGTVFLVMAFWVLIPEKESTIEKQSYSSLFWASLLGFFWLEMADKTQVAVITLAGAFQSIMPVVLGATVGILLVTGPSLWFGYKFANRIPVRLMRIIASITFAALGLWTFLAAAGWMKILFFPE